jgi:trehalose 6-phosphate synthase
MHKSATSGQQAAAPPLIVIASNRGPFSFTTRKDGTFDVQRGAGGLVTALSGIANEENVLWIAAALSAGDQAWAQQMGDAPVNVQGMDLKLVQIQGRKQYRQYYNVISNPLLWFIEHQLWDTPRHPTITQDTWAAWDEGYVAVNRLFADQIADVIEAAGRPAIVFPQDYHLYLVPRFLRERLGDSVVIQPFVHIPWPGPDAWRVLPERMRTTLLEALLMADRIGFQTRRDAFNFVQTSRFYLDDAHSYGSRGSIVFRERKVEAKSYPISVDVDELTSMVASREIERLTQEVRSFTGARQLILRIDRVELSKNIIRGLQAYRSLLTRYTRHRGRVQMIALLVPSRMEVNEYQAYLRDVLSEAGMINAEFGDGNWEPVRVLLGNNYPRAIATMRLYDVLLVNPIADGMNLVAKEGVLVNENDGVLVLSEHAGAFYELGDDALTISPFDTFGTAEALHQALTMPADERHARAERMRRIVQRGDINRWFRDQLEDARTSLASQDRNDSTPATP